MFIRTKDGRIYDLQSKEVSSWEYIDNDTAINEYGVEGAFYTIYYFDENKGCYSEYDGKGGHSCDFIEEKDIIKQSDNPEELIEQVVVIKENGKPRVWSAKKFFNEIKNNGYKYLLNLIKRGKLQIKGAIWTSKGLIYVAKMNNDGKLILI